MNQNNTNPDDVLKVADIPVPDPTNQPDTGEPQVPADLQDQQPGSQRLYADKYKDVDNLERGYINLEEYTDRKKTQYEHQIADLENQLNEVKQTQPLVDFIQGDPQSLQYLTQRMGQNQQSQQSQFQQPIPVNQPANPLPPRPVDYNELDAHDPSTPSGQWHQQVQATQQQQNQQVLLNQVGQLIDNKFTSWDERNKQATLKQQQATQLETMQTEFRATHTDIDDVAFNNFIDFVKSPPENVTLDDFYTIYQRHQSNSRPTSQPTLQSKVVDVRNQPVINAATIPAQSQPNQPDEADDFIKGIINETKQFKVFPS